jgi:hypothetical protein
MRVKITDFAETDLEQGYFFMSSNRLDLVPTSLTLFTPILTPCVSMAVST